MNFPAVFFVLHPASLVVNDLVAWYLCAPGEHVVVKCCIAPMAAFILLTEEPMGEVSTLMAYKELVSTAFN